MSLKNNTIYKPIQQIFCKYLSINNINDETQRIESLKKCDSELLQFGNRILQGRQNINNNEYLSDNFDLVDNIRYMVDRLGNPTNEVLSIYTNHIIPIFTSNLERNSESRVRITIGLENNADIRRVNNYDRYIITTAVTAKFIALYNKKILMTEMSNLLRSIVIKLYACYNRIRIPGVGGFKSDSTSGNQNGGALFVSTDPEMKKIEGKIIMLYNLFNSDILSVKSLEDPYIAKPRHMIFLLMNMSAAFIGLGIAAGVVAAIPSTLPIVAAVTGTVGTCYTQYRGKIQDSYCISEDTRDVIKKLYKYFNLKISDCDDCATSITNTALQPRYTQIKTDIDTFSQKVNNSYDKYNNIFNFIIETNLNILPQNKCDPLPDPIPLNQTDILIKSTLATLEDIVETDRTTWENNQQYINAGNTLLSVIPNKACTMPTTVAPLRTLISTIKGRQGEDLLNYLNTNLSCRDRNAEETAAEERRLYDVEQERLRLVAKSENAPLEPRYESYRDGGRRKTKGHRKGKTKRMRKGKTQKRIRKGRYKKTSLK